MPSESDATLSEIIASGRKRLGLSLRELADKIISEDGKAITPQYLSDIEHGRRVPGDYVLGKLAKALDVDKDLLFHRAGRLAPDIPNTAVSGKAIERAYQLFRRSLKNA